MTDPIIDALELSDEFTARFRIERVLGEGGMGYVVLATQLDLNRPVAVKFLKDDYAAHDPTALRRFVDEGKICSSLRHPNLVQLYLSGRDSVLYLVYEYVEGRPLDAILRGRPQNRLPVEEALNLARQICDGMAHAHEHHVVHRDLKPANILVSAAGSVAKVTDFGIARDPLTGPRTRSGVVIGTPTYMAPEQAKGVRDIDARADVYALAAMIYEMLAGRPPHVGQGLDVLRMHVDPAELPPPLARLQPLVPGRLAAVIHRGLEKEREARYADAGEMGRALTEVAERLRGGAPDPSAEGTVRFDSGVEGALGGGSRGTGPATVALAESKAPVRGRVPRALARATPASPSRATGAASREKDSDRGVRRRSVIAVVVLGLFVALVVGSRMGPGVPQNVRISGVGTSGPDGLVLMLESTEDVLATLVDAGSGRRLPSTEYARVHRLEIGKSPVEVPWGRPRLSVATRSGETVAVELPAVTLDLSAVAAGRFGEARLVVTGEGGGEGREEIGAAAAQAVLGGKRFSLVQQAGSGRTEVVLSWDLTASGATLVCPPPFVGVRATLAAVEEEREQFRRLVIESGAPALAAEVEARAADGGVRGFSRSDEGSASPHPVRRPDAWSVGWRLIEGYGAGRRDARAHLSAALALDLVAGRSDEAARLVRFVEDARVLSAAMTVRSYGDPELKRWSPPPSTSGGPAGFWNPGFELEEVLGPLYLPRRVAVDEYRRLTTSGSVIGRLGPGAPWREGLLMLANLAPAYRRAAPPFYMDNAFAGLGALGIFRDLMGQYEQTWKGQMKVPCARPKIAGGRALVALTVYQLDVGVVLRVRVGGHQALALTGRCSDYHQFIPLMGLKDVKSVQFHTMDFSPEHLDEKPIYHVLEVPSTWVAHGEPVIVDALAVGVPDRIGTNARMLQPMGMQPLSVVALDVPLVRDVVVSVPTEG